MGVQTTAIAYADFQAYVAALGNKGLVFSCQIGTRWGAAFVSNKLDTLILLDSQPAVTAPPASFATDFPNAIAATSDYNAFILR
jgi:hypothetical protein